MASGGPEAYYKFFVVEAGDGIRPSSHIMIGVGSSDSYIQQWKGMDQDLVRAKLQPHVGVRMHFCLLYLIFYKGDAARK